MDLHNREKIYTFNLKKSVECVIKVQDIGFTMHPQIFAPEKPAFSGYQHQYQTNI